MSADAPGTTTASAPPSEQAAAQPGFVLLFSTPLLPGDSARLPRQAFAALPEPAAARLAQWREAAQTHVLGASFLQTQRLQRIDLGRMPLSAADPLAPNQGVVGSNPAGRTSFIKQIKALENKPTLTMWAFFRLLRGVFPPDSP